MSAQDTPKTVTIDVTNGTTVAESIARLDDAARELIATALRTHASSRNDEKILATIREVLASDFPDRTPVGVLFTPKRWADGYFLTDGHDHAEVLFTDGDSENVDFSRAFLDDVFREEFGCRGQDCVLSVDLREDGHLDLHTDGLWEDINTHFEEPTST